MPTTLREVVRAARKKHHCGLCNANIEVGEKHHVSTNVWDGRVYDWRTCESCARDNIVGEVYYWAGYPSEGVGYDSAREWAHEYAVSASPLGEIARAWLLRSNCTCEDCDDIEGANSCE